MTKSKPPKKDDHVLHEVLLRETHEPQPPSQWGYVEWDKRRISCILWHVHRLVVLKLKVLEVREKSDEIQDLSVSAVWIFESEESKVR